MVAHPYGASRFAGLAGVAAAIAFSMFRSAFGRLTPATGTQASLDPGQARHLWLPPGNAGLAADGPLALASALAEQPHPFRNCHRGHGVMAERVMPDHGNELSHRLPLMC